MRYFVTFPLAGRSEERAVDVTPRGDGGFDVRVDGQPVAVDAVELGGAINVRVGDRVFDLWLDGEAESLRVCGGGLRIAAKIETDRSRIGGRGSRPSGGGEVRAPMPGRVVKVLCAEGDAVEAGTPLVVVEAMKMENELCADAAGVVTAIRAAAGQTVEGGATLVELGPAPEP